jgi:GGDEF domain-containing protein
MSDAHANGTVTRDVPATGATQDGGTNFGEQLALLLHRLARSTGGVGFVYETLHELAARHELTDAILTIDVPSLGRQAFRLGRRPLDAELGRALAAAPGLVTEPDVVPAAIRSIVEDAAQIAVSLQVAQASSIRDSLSGLLSRRGFNEALRTVAAQSSRYGWPFTLVLLSLGTREARVDPDSEEQAIRRAGRALARALRSGDIGTRIDGTTFAAVLPNAGAEAINALLERIAGELPSVALAELSLGAANAPRESVDPVELFRLASARMSEERTSAP